MVHEMICIVCPRGCTLQVDTDNDYKVSGHKCPRGVVYGQKELINPSRTLTTTVKCSGGNLRRVPVKSKTELPKDQVMACAKLLAGITLQTPVKRGDIVLSNIVDTGVDIVVTRDVS